jgi:hypothetical protein
MLQQGVRHPVLLLCRCLQVRQQFPAWLLLLPVLLWAVPAGA